MEINLQEIEQWLLKKGLEMAAAVICLFIIWRLIDLATAFLKKKLEDKVDNKAMLSLGYSFVNIGLKVYLVVALVGFLGVQTASLVAALGSIGIAIALALQGSLSNVASGILIVWIRPFKMGDFVQIEGETGCVESIDLFTTTLVMPKQKRVIIPNASIANGVVTNYTEKGRIRCEVDLGIAYDADLKLAKTVLLEMLQDHPKVLVDPQPEILVSALGESSVDLILRSYCTPLDYWDVYFQTTELAKLTLDAHDIEIPFPQRVVHLAQNDAQQ